MSVWRADVGPEATPEEIARARRDVEWARVIGAAIETEYPGHYPKVKVDSWGGIAQIAHPLLPENWGEIVYLSRIVSDPGLKCCKDAFGRCLERFYLRRGRRNHDEWADASRKYHRLKHGILRQTNWATGERKFILPAELSR